MEEAGTEARFLLAPSKRHSGFAFELVSPNLEGQKHPRCFDGADLSFGAPQTPFSLASSKCPLEDEAGSDGPRVGGGLMDSSERRVEEGTNNLKVQELAPGLCSLAPSPEQGPGGGKVWFG